MGETTNEERYREQLSKLKRAVADKHLEFVSRYQAIIFHLVNARPVKNYLEKAAEPYGPDLAPGHYKNQAHLICN